jgi:hypothetical protein
MATSSTATGACVAATCDVGAAAGEQADSSIASSSIEIKILFAFMGSLLIERDVLFFYTQA